MARQVPEGVAGYSAIQTLWTSIQTYLQNILSSHTQSASSITAGSMTGKVIANNNTDYSKQVRNITFSTSEPTASDGANGDIWIVYE